MAYTTVSYGYGYGHGRLPKQRVYADRVLVDPDWPKGGIAALSPRGYVWEFVRLHLGIKWGLL